MTYSNHFRVAGLLTCLALTQIGNIFAAPTEPNTEKPNILLIMADDMGYSDIGCYGGEINTPNIDRLAEEGLRFSQFYNNAICCPTRASLLTGVYSHQAGMGNMVMHEVGGGKPGPYQGYLNDKSVTIAEVLQNAGYSTYMSGKWHVGEFRPNWPTDRGFDHSFSLISGAANYFDITRGKRADAVRIMEKDGLVYNPPKEGFYMTTAITDHAVTMLDAAGDEDEPFFMYVTYTAPHWPLHALPEDVEKYRGKYMVGWDEIRKNRYERQIEMGLFDEESCPLTPRDKDAPAWEDVENKEAMDLKMAVYAAQIDRMDQGIGKILDKLKQIGQKENTLVIFLADNGASAQGGPYGRNWREDDLPPGGVDSYQSYGFSWANASNTPFRYYKIWMHEGGIATPFIASWPAQIKQHGEFTGHQGHIMDIMATCCDVAGVDYPDMYNDKPVTALEGKSLLPVLKGETADIHKELFWYREGHKAVRQGKWKLVALSGEAWELYDLDLDRTELNDLATIHPEKVEELNKLHAQWAEKCGVYDFEEGQDLGW
ncbi:MAG: arylsulfatase [Bacteroidetes bacterium]|nr:MAG: arylsulfatase [Bacteroidota bacterium]